MSKMLVTYNYNGKEYYDINGVVILSKLSKSQCKKIVRDYAVDKVSYLNRNLYSKENVLEFCNLIHLRSEVSLRLMNKRAEDVESNTNQEPDQ